MDGNSRKFTLKIAIASTMPNEHTFESVKDALRHYHEKLKAVRVLEYQSPIANDSFPGDFNVSGYHAEIQDLSKAADSFWGIDRCLRLQEKVDAMHSYAFHMGIFAKSVDLQNNFIDPFQDHRFEEIQEQVLQQFMEALLSLGVISTDIEVTYLDGAAFGGSGARGRDRELQRQYVFPQDTVTKSFFENQQAKVYLVKSLANIDIRPTESALVGPRAEIALGGIEIATIVFDCFQVRGQKLMPINYVAGYAIGMERLVAALNKKANLLLAIERYQSIMNQITRLAPAVSSSLFIHESFQLAFGIEALAVVGDSYKSSKSRSEMIRKLKKLLYESAAELGISADSVANLFAKVM